MKEHVENARGDRYGHDVEVAKRAEGGSVEPAEHDATVGRHAAFHRMLGGPWIRRGVRDDQGLARRRDDRTEGVAQRGCVAPDRLRIETVEERQAPPRGPIELVDAREPIPGAPVEEPQRLVDSLSGQDGLEVTEQRRIVRDGGLGSEARDQVDQRLGIEGLRHVDGRSLLRWLAACHARTRGR